MLQSRLERGCRPELRELKGRPSVIPFSSVQGMSGRAAAFKGRVLESQEPVLPLEGRGVEGHLPQPGSVAPYRDPPILPTWFAESLLDLPGACYTQNPITPPAQTPSCFKSLANRNWVFLFLDHPPTS